MSPFDDSLRIITEQSLRYRINEAVKAGHEVVMVELHELDIIMGTHDGQPDQGTTEELFFTPPDPNGPTEELPTVDEERTRPCLSQQ